MTNNTLFIGSNFMLMLFKIYVNEHNRVIHLTIHSLLIIAYKIWKHIYIYTQTLICVCIYLGMYILNLYDYKIFVFFSSARVLRADMMYAEELQIYIGIVMHKCIDMYMYYVAVCFRRSCVKKCGDKCRKQIKEKNI